MKRTFKLSIGVFGEGDPKICAPIVGRTKEDVFKAAEVIAKTEADVVEWRETGSTVWKTGMNCSKCYRESADGSEKKHCFSRSGQSMKVDSLQS